MISIKIGNEFIDMFSDTTVSVNYSNPDSLESEKIPVTYSENVEIPATKNNMSIFGIDKKSKSIKNTKLNGELYSGSVAIMSVVCEIQSATINTLENKISLLVTDRLSYILTDMKNTKLSKIYDDMMDVVYCKFSSTNPSLAGHENKCFVDLYNFDKYSKSNGVFNVAYTSVIDGDKMCQKPALNANYYLQKVLQRYNINTATISSYELMLMMPFKEKSPVKNTYDTVEFKGSFPKYICRQKKASTDYSTHSYIYDKACKTRAHEFRVYSKGHGMSHDVIYTEDVSISSDSGYGVIKNIWYNNDVRFLNQRSFAIKPSSFSSWVGAQAGIERYNESSPTANGMPDCKIEVYMIVKDRDFYGEDNIVSEFRCATLSVGADGKVYAVEDHDEWLYQKPIETNPSDIYNISYTFILPSNMKVTDSAGVNYSMIGGELTNGLEEPNSAHFVLKHKDYMLQKVSYMSYDIVRSDFSDIESDYANTNTVYAGDLGNGLMCTKQSEYDLVKDKYTDWQKRHFVSMKNTLEADGITMYDFFSMFMERFNIKPIIINGVLRNSLDKNITMYITDEANSTQELTPVTFEKSYRDVFVKNKLYGMKYEKAFTGDCIYDSEKYRLNNDSCNDNVVELKSSIVIGNSFNEIVGVDDQTAELLKNNSAASIGLTPNEMPSLSDYGYRFGYRRTMSGDIKLNTRFPMCWSELQDMSTCSNSDNENSILYKKRKEIIYTSFDYCIADKQTSDTGIDAVASCEIMNIDTNAIVSVRAYVCGNSMTIRIPANTPSGRYYFWKSGFTSDIPLYTSESVRFCSTRMETLKVGSGTSMNRLKFDGHVRKPHLGVDDYEYSESSIWFELDLKSYEYYITVPLLYTDYYMTGVSDIAMSAIKIFFKNSVRDKFVDDIKFNTVTHNNPNDGFSLSLNKYIGGENNAYEKHFKNEVNSMISGESVYMDTEILATKESQKDLLNGCVLNIDGIDWRLIEASDIVIGAPCLVKVKLKRL